MEGRRIETELRMLRVSLGLQALLLGVVTAWLLLVAGSLLGHAGGCSWHSIDCNAAAGTVLSGVLVAGVVGLVLTVGLACSAALLGRSESAWLTAIVAETLLATMMVCWILFASPAGDWLVVPGGCALFCVAVLVSLCRPGMRLRCTPAARGRGAPPRPR
jgi:hypothetical protein